MLLSLARGATDKDMCLFFFLTPPSIDMPDWQVSYYRNLTLWPRDRFTRNIAAPFANHP